MGKKTTSRYNISQLALGGRCFHNAVLRHGLIDQLTSTFFNYLAHNNCSRTTAPLR